MAEKNIIKNRIVSVAKLSLVGSSRKKRLRQKGEEYAAEGRRVRSGTLKSM